jgi:hypothetical protein
MTPTSWTPNIWKICRGEINYTYIDAESTCKLKHYQTSCPLMEQKSSKYGDTLRRLDQADQSLDGRDKQHHSRQHGECGPTFWTASTIRLET